MDSPPESFKTYKFSYDEQLSRARWFKEDLEKGGWNVAHKDERSTFWVKVIPEHDISINVLYEYKMPLSAENFSKVFSPKSMKDRAKWDRAWLDIKLLETYPDGGGHVAALRSKFSAPFSDRDFVVFFPPEKEIDWYGKRAIYNGTVHATHPSKPANVGGVVRATNGGNIYIAIPDEKDPENACTLFGLSCNDYHARLPTFVWAKILSRKLPRTFIDSFEGMVDGYNNYVAPAK